MPFWYTKFSYTHSPLVIVSAFVLLIRKSTHNKTRHKRKQTVRYSHFILLETITILRALNTKPPGPTVYFTISSGGALTVNIQFISPYCNFTIGGLFLVYTFVKHSSDFSCIYGLPSCCPAPPCTGSLWWRWTSVRAEPRRPSGLRPLRASASRSRGGGSAA